MPERTTYNVTVSGATSQAIEREFAEDTLELASGVGRIAQQIVAKQNQIAELQAKLTRKANRLRRLHLRYKPGLNMPATVTDCVDEENASGAITARYFNADAAAFRAAGQ